MLARSPPASSKGGAEGAGKKLLVGAGCTLAFEGLLGHLLEFTKVVKQTNAHLSYTQVVRSIVQEKGVLAMWDGFVPWGAVQAVAKGAVFAFANTECRNRLEGSVASGAMGSDTAEIIAGGIGGGFQGLVLSPTLLLKTRVMTDPIFRTKMGLVETTMQSAQVGLNVIRREGGTALMKGSLVFSAKRVADWSTRYFFAIQAEHHIFGATAEKKLSTVEKLTASLIGGFGSTLATIPLDVLVAQIQQASKAGERVSVVEQFAAQYREGGLAGIIGFSTRGFMMRAVHVALTTALMKTATSYVYERV